MQRVLVVGATGLIGSAIVQALGATSEVITAARQRAMVRVDISDPASIRNMYGEVGGVDAVVCAAGTAPFVSWSEATDDDWAHGVSNKLLGQVNLVRLGAEFVNDGGCFILTTGIFANHPVPGSSILTTANSGVEGFVRSAALEIGRGVRVTAVAPGWVAETMAANGMDPAPGLPALEVAGVYLEVLSSSASGVTVPAVRS